MQRVWQIFYSFVLLPIMWLAVKFLSLFKAKVRRAVEGRRTLFESLEKQVARIKPGKRLWFHVSSMGEFEQAKPIIAELKSRYPDLRIIVTFFSPSGYEHSKKYQLADCISYIPFDTQRNARRFLDLIQPTVAVMVRYDVWPNHIWELHHRNIPTIIANATMRRQTNRRLPLAKQLHHYIYNVLTAILTVSQSDVEAFRFFNLTDPELLAIGDTRYDQVTARSLDARKRHLIPERVLSGKKVIVAGSTWPEDEEVIVPVLLKLQDQIPNIVLILVPHEPTVRHIEELEDDLSGKTSFIRFSHLNDYENERVIIVDSVGILLSLYKYAHIAYIGGSFKQGIHNVLEAAAYGIPVVFGPRHRNSQEPLMLVGHGGGFVVDDTKVLYRTLRNLLEDETARRTAGDRAAQFVQKNVGATDQILKHLERYV
jgi:3-deoxy-D-manno-octulosonic-acid transferase